MANSLKLDLKGFEAYLDMMRKLGEDVELLTETVLLDSAEIVNDELHNQMRKHRLTGKTELSIREPKVTWKGDAASIKVGFDIKKGGEPAIYLEYGRPTQKPTPVLKPAMEATEKDLREYQERALKEAMERAKK